MNLPDVSHTVYHRDLAIVHMCISSAMMKLFVVFPFP